tara:strand:+ start:1167 stop:1424 length:258 start_codon:yes stop_codon:yes gene_type:complete
MTIRIDKRSKDSAYITVGNITVYVEHSPGCAEDYVQVFQDNPEDEFFETFYDFEKDLRVIVNKKKSNLNRFFKLREKDPKKWEDI